MDQQQPTTGQFGAQNAPCEAADVPALAGGPGLYVYNMDAAYTNGVARQTIADHINATWPQAGVVVTACSVRGRASRTGASDLGTTPTDPRKTRCNPDPDDEEVFGAPLKRLRLGSSSFEVAPISPICTGFPVPISPTDIGFPACFPELGDLSSPISEFDLGNLSSEDDLSYLDHDIDFQRSMGRDFAAQEHPMHATPSSSEEEDEEHEEEGALSPIYIGSYLLY